MIALWAWIMPWVNDQVAWDDPVRAGESIQVTDDVTMTAASGWGVISGLRTTDETRGGEKAVGQVVLVKSGVAFTTLQGPFDGSARALLSSVERIAATGGADFHTSSSIRNVTTASGLRGVAQDFASGRNVGTVTTFVVGGVGIEVQVVGPEAQLAALSSETDAMIASLARDGSGAS
ncbi:hypothetical protein ACHMWU_17755 [Aeromicrobium sp. UC242_57]